MNFRIWLAMIVAVMVGVPALAAQGTTPLSVASPGGRNIVAVTLDATGRVNYTVVRDGETILAPSPISFTLDKGSLGDGMAIAGSERRSADATWKPVVGKAAQARDHYNELTVHLVEAGGQRKRVDLVVRAYDDGIAFRSVIPAQQAIAGASIRWEDTNFAFARPYGCWGFNVGHFNSSHEGEFDRVDSAKLRDHHYFDLPFLCETGRGAFMITEADLLDHAGMYLSGRGDGGPGLRTRLSPSREDGNIAVRMRLGRDTRTPWRVVMLADKAGQLNDSMLLLNLSTPSRIMDTSWIRPGKASWDWWNGGKLASIPTAGTNTATAKAFIDFAAANGFEYALVDDGWYAGSGQAPTFLPGTNILSDAPNFRFAEVADYAKKRGVGLWVWLHWLAVDDQMDEAMQYLADHGVVGIKVDFMDRDDQAMVNWYTRLLTTAARYKLMVNFHGAYPPRGLTRTYPNYMTQEGVLGAEYNKWSRRITAGHNVMLAYTRGVLGPMDYTPGGFRNVSPAEFQPRFELPFVQTTRAHGLAMYVVFESPVAMVSDSPDTYAESPAGLDFVRAVPTSWDETRFLAGEVGDHIVVARRKGKRWYVGAMNGEAARPVRLPLAFLGRGQWTADLWLDGAGRPDSIRRESRRVTASDTLDLNLAAAGGGVAVLSPR